MRNTRLFRKQPQFLSIIVAGLFILSNHYVYVRQPQAAENINSQLMICIPDRPIVYVNDSVAVEAFISGAPDAVTEITWKSSVGKIEGKGLATWSFPRDDQSSSREGPAVAYGFATHNSLGKVECQVRVYFVDPPSVTRGKPTVLSGRTFLLPGRNEPEGYGLYSYLLLAMPPRNDHERERYLQALESFLLVVDPIEQLERYRDRSTLNITLLPLKVTIDYDHDLTDRKQARALAIKLLKVYHYERAKVLLSDLGMRTLSGGPFLVARSDPKKTSNATRLELDMSHIVPDLIWHWTKAFCLLATQEPTWREAAMLKFFLNFRNVIAIASRDMPISKELDKLVRLIKS
jgi:hypothetical protein